MASSEVIHAEFTAKERKDLAEEGEALPDGSYPIRNTEDLHNAIQGIGRASNREKVQAWILKRAKELELEDELPEWLKSPESTADDEMEHFDIGSCDFDSFLAHHGIKGMKWGVRRDRKTLDRLAGRTPARIGTRTNSEGSTVADRGLSKRHERVLTSGGMSALLKDRQIRKGFKDTSKDIQKLKGLYERGAIDNSYYAQAVELIDRRVDAIFNTKKNANVTVRYNIVNPAGYKFELNGTLQENMQLISQISLAQERNRRLRHAEEEDVYISIRVDEDGFITNVDLDEDWQNENSEKVLQETESLNSLENTVNSDIEHYDISTCDFDGFLTHYGIPGMRWGVRRDRNTLNRLAGRVNQRGVRQKRSGHISSVRTTVGRRTSGYMAQNVNAQTKAYQKIYRRAARNIRAGTRALNNDPRYKGQNLKKNERLRRDYMSEYRTMVETQLNSAANRGFGKMTLNFTFHSDRQLAPDAFLSRKAKGAEKKTQRQAAKEQIEELRKRRAQHSEIDELFGLYLQHIDYDPEDDLFPVKLTIDSNGFITGMTIDETEGEDDDETEETMQEEVEDSEVEHAEELVEDYLDSLDGNLSKASLEGFLEHHGIKGMRWGVRRDRATLDRLAGRTRNSNSGGSSGNRSGSGSNSSSSGSGSGSSDTKGRSRKAQREAVKRMSDDEIRDMIGRLKMERELHQLRNQNSGKTFTSEFLQKTRQDMLSTAARGVVDIASKELTKYMVAKAMGVDPKEIGKNKKK